MKKVVIGLIALLVVLVAAALIAPGFVDWNQYKDQVRQAAREATGRDLTIAGDISLSVLPAPALQVDDVRFANIEGGESPDMVALKSLEVRVALLPLISQRIEVQSVRLRQPTIVLEKLADGRANWQFEPAGGGEGAPAPDAGGEGAGGRDVSVGEIEIVDGTLIYRDFAAGQEQRIQGLNARASAQSLQGPFEAEGTLDALGMKLGFNAAVGSLSDPAAMPISLTVSLPEKDTAITVSGSVAQPASAPALEAKLSVRSANLAAALTAAAPGTTLPPLLAAPLEVRGAISADSKQAGLNDLEIDLGALKARGALSAGFDGAPSFDVALKVGRIDLDALLAAGGKDGKTGKQAGKAADTGPQAAAGGGTALPKDLSGTIDIAVDGVSYRQGVVRQVNLSASLVDGRISLTRAAALLPGGSSLSLGGDISLQPAPSFKGQLEMTADNLRGLLAWLSVDPAGVPADRLANMSLTAGLAANADEVTVSDINLRLDSTQATGGLVWRLQSRPAFGASLVIDKLNVDGYLPAAGGGGATAGGSGNAQTTAQGGGSDNALAPLGTFDTNSRIVVNELTYNRTKVKGVEADIRLVRGDLTIHKAEIRDLAGAAFAVTGTANGLAGAAPKADLRVKLTARDLGGLAQLAGLALPVDPATLKDPRVDMGLKGDLANAMLDGTVSLAGARLSLDGTVRNPQTNPTYDLKVALRHDSLARLSTTFGLGAAPVRGADGPVDFGGTLKGGSQSVAMNLTGSLAGMSLKAAGNIASLKPEPALDLTLEAGHPDIVALVRSFGVDWRPAQAKLGAFRFATGIKGTPKALNFPGITGAVGPAQFSGEVSAALDRARPYVNANLQASEILVDAFLPAKARDAAAGGGGGKPAASGAQRWSRAPIDLAGLDAADADIRLAAPKITFQQYPFVDPRLALKLDNGRLTVRELTGKLFQGAIGLNATVDSKPRPAVSLSAKVEGADVHEALTTAMGFGDVSGSFNFDGTFSTAGSSEWALVNALNGDARVSAVNGAIQGFDLANLNERLKQLNRTSDYIDLITRATQGGQTAYRSVAGTWQIRNGVARTEDMNADVDGATGTTRGRIELPAWQMDLKNSFTLTGHSDAPAIGVNLAGSMDNPQRDVKTAELEKWLARRFGERVLKDQLGGKLGDKLGGDAGKLLQGVLGGGGSAGGSGSGGGSQDGAQSGGDAGSGGTAGSAPAPQQNESTEQRVIKGLFNQLLKNR